jgi:hypothetical protein
VREGTRIQHRETGKRGVVTQTIRSTPRIYVIEWDDGSTTTTGLYWLRPEVTPCSQAK